MVLMWHSFNKGYYGRASMFKCHRYSICQPIILSLASHSAVHVHKMPTWAVAMAATPSFSNNPDSILVKAMLYLHNPPPSLFLCLSSLLCFLQVSKYWETYSWPCFTLRWWLIVFLSLGVLCYLPSSLLPAPGYFNGLSGAPRAVWLLCRPPNITLHKSAATSSCVMYEGLRPNFRTKLN